MKKIARRLAALALVLALAAAALGRTALASSALGSELVDRTVKLAEGVSWTAQRLWSGSKDDSVAENYITYTPGSGVTPMVYNGTYVASRSSVMAAAAELEKQGHRVIAGINGGFFNSDGTIAGILVTDGVVRSLDLYNGTLLGFTRDGRVFIDESKITKTVSWEAQDAPVQYNLTGFNAYRNGDALGGLYLYNRDFSSKVSPDVNRGCVAVVLTPASDDGDDDEPPASGGWWPWGGYEPPVSGGGETEDDASPSEPDSGLTMNGTLTLSVKEIVDTKAGDAFNGVLTDGRYMLYANYYNGNDGLLDALRSLTPGQQVTVTVSGVSEQWADAAYGVSGLYTLLRDGEVASGLLAGEAPRTAVGVKENGEAVFYTIDGRQSEYSVGATYAQVARRLRELGCVSAVALDGGGSTSLGATLPGQQKFELLNRPSQINRPLNNFIFLVAGDEYAGMAPGFYLSSDTQVVLAGASLDVSAVGYDRWGEADPEMTPDWSAAGGTVTGAGLTAVYTAGNAVGTYAVSAGSGSDLPVLVVDKLSGLCVTWEGRSGEEDTLDLLPTESVDLSAAGVWWNLPVAMGDGDVTWKADTAIGTVDASGVFKAAGGNKAVSGSITASAGGQTASVQVTVQAYPFTDMGDHWSVDYVIRLYKLGITEGIEQPDGTHTFDPSGKLTRGELLAFITRLLRVDTDEYQDVELPFADADTITEWMLPYVKAMYALGVLSGSEGDGVMYAYVNNSVSREEAMTMLGRVLADQVSQDLSGFADSSLISDWALPYVETMVGLKIVEGSEGRLDPKLAITRGEAAKLLAEIDGLDKAELPPVPSDPELDEPGTQGPDNPDGPEQQPDQPGEDTGDPVLPDDPSVEPAD